MPSPPVPATVVRLSDAIATLRKFYGRPQSLPTKDPFELILLENVAYLAPAARRREAFELLQKTIGTKPELILAATRAALERVTAYGILKSRFAAKLRECAQTAVDLFAGNLDTALHGPIENARRALRKFPGIGEPTADKILLFCGRLAVSGAGVQRPARTGPAGVFRRKTGVRAHVSREPRRGRRAIRKNSGLAGSALAAASARANALQARFAAVRAMPARRRVRPRHSLSGAGVTQSVRGSAVVELGQIRLELLQRVQIQIHHMP